MIAFEQVNVHWALLIYVPQVTVICTRICLLEYPETAQS